jgi:hypothetical protein
MEGLVAVLKDTPIPTILVVSGIVFLFLALAGQIAGKLEVPPERQKWSALAGAVLLSAGLLLYISPARPQGDGDLSGGVTFHAAASQPAPLSQAPASESSASAPTSQGSSAPTLSELAGNPVLGEGESCFEEIFSAIPADRVEKVEIGKVDKELLAPHQNKKDRAGFMVLELGEPVLAITYIYFEEDSLFKIGSVVDAACQPLAFANASRGGAREVLENWDSLAVTVEKEVYNLRFGYSGGIVSLDTRKFQE